MVQGPVRISGGPVAVRSSLTPTTTNELYTLFRLRPPGTALIGEWDSAEPQRDSLDRLDHLWHHVTLGLL